MEKKNVTNEIALISEQFNEILNNLKEAINNAPENELLVAETNTWRILYQNINRLAEMTNHKIEYLNYEVVEVEESYKNWKNRMPDKREADGHLASNGIIDRKSYQWVDLTQILEDTNSKIEELLNQVSSLLNENYEFGAEGSVIGELSIRMDAAIRYVDSILPLNEKEYVEYQKKISEPNNLKDRIAQADKEAQEKTNEKKQKTQEKQYEAQHEM